MLSRTIRTYALVAAATIAVSALPCLLAQQVDPLKPPVTAPPATKLDVPKTYTPSGFMGDGSAGTKFVQFTETYKEDPKSPLTCIKVTYTPGPEQWAGMYWQNKPNNWGDKPGDDLSKKGYAKITFSAKGDKDGIVVEFKAGGIDSSGKPYKDSFEKSTGKLTLEKGWKQYTISLEGQNLSSVIGVFCWVAAATSNSGGVTFYLKDIQYE
jgi:hypothetical protein